MKPRNIALIAAGVVIYILLAFIHASNKANTPPYYAEPVTVEYEEQQPKAEAAKLIPEDVKQEGKRKEPTPQAISDDPEQQLKQALSSLSDAEAQIALLRGEIKEQKELIGAQSSSYEARIDNLSLKLGLREQELAYIQKKMVKIVRLDAVTLQQAIDKQTKHIQVIENQLAEQKNFIHQLKEKNKTLHNENKQLTQKLQERGEVIKQSQKLGKQHSDTVKAKKLAKGELVSEIDHLNKRLSEEIEKNNVLVQDVEKQAVELAGSERTIAKLKASLAETQPKLAVQENLQKEKVNQIGLLQEETQNLFNENTAIKGLLTKAESTIALLEDGLGKAELKAEAMFRYGQEQEAIAIQSTEKLSELKQQIIENEDNLLALKGEQAVSDDKLNIKIESLNVAEAQLNEISSTLTAKEDELNSLKNEMAGQVAAERSKRVELETNAGLLTESIEGLNNELVTLIIQIENKNTALTDIEAALAETKTVLSTTEEERSSLRGQLETMSVAIGEVEALKTALNERTEALTAAEEELAGLSDLREQLTAKTENINELQAKAERLAIIEPQMVQLQDTVNRLEAEKTAMAGQLETMTVAIGEVEALKTALNEKTEALTVAEEELAGLSDLREQLAAKTENINELQAKAERLAIIEPQMVQRQDSVNRLEAEKTAMAGQLETMTVAIGEVEALKTALNEKTEALTVAEDKLAGLSDLREQLAAKTATISRLQAKAERLAIIEPQMVQMQDTVKTLKAERINLTNRLDETLTTRLNETLATIQKMDALRLALDEKNKALFAAEAEIIELNRLRQELEVKTTTISKLQDQVAVLAKIDPQLSRLRASITVLEEEKTVLTGRLGETLAALQEMEELKVSLAQKSKALADNEVKQAKLEQETASLKATLGQKSKALTAAETKLAELESLRKELNTKAGELDELQGKVAALAHLEPKLIELQNSITNLNEEKAALTSKLEQSKADLNAAEVKKSALSANLSEVKAQLQPLEEKVVQAEQIAKESARKTDELALTKERFAEKEAETSRMQSKIDELTRQTNEIEFLRQQLDEKAQKTIQLNEKIEIMTEPVQTAVVKDSDEDGVADSLDLCPGSTPGSNVDALGCEADEKIALTDITFATGTADLTEASKESLNNVARTLALHTESKLEVAGFTDSLGNINRNKSLSLQRATAVMNYLVEQGVAADRLTARGYGPANPIATNNTPEGRALNRRVELHKVLPSAE